MSRSPPFSALEGSVADFYDMSCSNLVGRWTPLGEWFEARNAAGVDPYQKSSNGRIAPITRGAYRDGRPFEGVNLASQDYLSLSSHPKALAAAVTAMNMYGVHSAGSAALMGNTALSVELEQRLGAFLGYSECAVFPSGWAAGYGVVKTLARQGDHVVIDVLAHACLQEAANDSRAQVHRFPHLSLEGVERRLTRIRSADPNAGILVVTETLFSMDSDVPDIRALQSLCQINGATLVVDCAHDLGAIGPGGRGCLGEQDMWGQIDVLMGSFSKTFASTGGFVACNSAGLRFGLRAACGPSTFTNAMSPVQAAIVLAALDMVCCEEGDTRRRSLMSNILRLRQGLERSGFVVLGRPSPIVPTVIGATSLARLATRYAIEAGGIVNLVEHPAVSRNSDRWRLQVMADHDDDHVDCMIKIAVKARDQARLAWSGMKMPFSMPMPHEEF